LGENGDLPERPLHVRLEAIEVVGKEGDPSPGSQRLLLLANTPNLSEIR
jgi:hypothetical protein